MSASESNPDAVAASNLWTLARGYMPARVVHVAAHLGVADLLASGTKTADALAQETNTAVVPLRRLLRALASLGLVDELEFGRFALTEAGKPLRSNVPVRCETSR